MVLLRSLAVWTISGCLVGLPGANGYSIDSSSISLSLIDARSGLIAESTLFIDDRTYVVADGIVWEGDAEGGSELSYETLVNGEVQVVGTITLPDDPLSLPNAIEAGEISVNDGGKTKIEVRLMTGDSKSEGSTQVQTIATWVSSIPFIAALVISFFNPAKELTFLVTIFLGSFIVEGSLGRGFVFAINDCLVEAIGDISHAYIYLLVLGMSGLVTMMRRSGGFDALNSYMSKLPVHSQRAQLIFFGIGIFIFFDQYASTIIGGELSSAIMKAFPVSVEKLAFIIDSTAAPVSSIFPVSTWAGVAVPLIQAELDRIIATTGTDDLYIVTSGFAVLLKSLKYQFYSLFMITLLLMVVLANRDVGPMLIAERSRYVRFMLGLNDSKPKGLFKRLQEEKKTNKVSRKMSSVYIPVIILNVFLWYCYGKYVPNTIAIEDYPDGTLLALVASISATVILTQMLYLWQKDTPTEPGTSFGLWRVWQLGLAKTSSDEEEPSAADRYDNASLGSPIVSPKSQGESVIQSVLQAARSAGTTDTNEKEKASKILAKIRGSVSGRSVDPSLDAKITEDHEATSCNQILSESGTASDQNNNLLVNPDEVEVMKSSSFSAHKSIILSDLEAQKEEETGDFSDEPCYDQATQGTTAAKKSLLPVHETIECFSQGGSQVLHMLILLTLVWAMRILFIQIGFDRAFAGFLGQETIEPENYPSMCFGIALMVSLIVRSAVGTIAILLPIISIPAYEACLGNPELFYGAIGALFSGAIAGEHVSPISDTTMLTCLATKCELTNHIWTQTPYAFFVAFVGFIVGTFAVSKGVYPVFVAYPIGILLMFFYIFICCCPIIEPQGNYDIFTELYLYYFKNNDLDNLKGSIAEVHRIEQEQLSEKSAKEALSKAISLALIGSGSCELLVTSSADSDGLSDDDSSNDGSVDSERERRRKSRRRSKARRSRSIESASYSDSDSDGSSSASGEEFGALSNSGSSGISGSMSSSSSDESEGEGTANPPLHNSNSGILSRQSTTTERVVPPVTSQGEESRLTTNNSEAQLDLENESSAQNSEGSSSPQPRAKNVKSILSNSARSFSLPMKARSWVSKSSKKEEDENVSTSQKPPLAPVPKVSTDKSQKKSQKKSPPGIKIPSSPKSAASAKSPPTSPKSPTTSPPTSPTNSKKRQDLGSESVFSEETNTVADSERQRSTRTNGESIDLRSSRSSGFNEEETATYVDDGSTIRTSFMRSLSDGSSFDPSYADEVGTEMSFETFRSRSASRSRHENTTERCDQFYF